MELQKYIFNRAVYTVDYRLSQFRAIKKDNSISFIDFGTTYGDRILCSMIKNNVLNYSLANL